MEIRKIVLSTVIPPANVSLLPTNTAFRMQAELKSLFEKAKKEPLPQSREMVSSC